MTSSKVADYERVVTLLAQLDETVSTIYHTLTDPWLQSELFAFLHVKDELQTRVRRRAFKSYGRTIPIKHAAADTSANDNLGRENDSGPLFHSLRVTAHPALSNLSVDELQSVLLDRAKTEGRAIQIVDQSKSKRLSRAHTVISQSTPVSAAITPLASNKRLSIITLATAQAPASVVEEPMTSPPTSASLAVTGDGDAIESETLTAPLHVEPPTPMDTSAVLTSPTPATVPTTNISTATNKSKRTLPERKSSTVTSASAVATPSTSTGAINGSKPKLFEYKRRESVKPPVPSVPVATAVTSNFAKHNPSKTADSLSRFKKLTATSSSSSISTNTSSSSSTNANAIKAPVKTRHTRLVSEAETPRTARVLQAQQAQLAAELAALQAKHTELAEKQEKYVQKRKKQEGEKKRLRSVQSMKAEADKQVPAPAPVSEDTSARASTSASARARGSGNTDEATVDETLLDDDVTQSMDSLSSTIDALTPVKTSPRPRSSARKHVSDSINDREWNNVLKIMEQATNEIKEIVPDTARHARTNTHSSIYTNTNNGNGKDSEVLPSIGSPKSPGRLTRSPSVKVTPIITDRQILNATMVAGQSCLPSPLRPSPSLTPLSPSGRMKSPRVNDGEVSARDRIEQPVASHSSGMGVQNQLLLMAATLRPLSPANKPRTPAAVSARCTPRVTDGDLARRDRIDQSLAPSAVGDIAADQLLLPAVSPRSMTLLPTDSAPVRARTPPPQLQPLAQSTSRPISPRSQSRPTSASSTSPVASNIATGPEVTATTEAADVVLQSQHSVDFSVLDGVLAALEQLKQDNEGTDTEASATDESEPNYEESFEAEAAVESVMTEPLTDAALDQIAGEIDTANDEVVCEESTAAPIPEAEAHPVVDDSVNTDIEAGAVEIINEIAEPDVAAQELAPAEESPPDVEGAIDAAVAELIKEVIEAVTAAQDAPEPAPATVPAVPVASAIEVPSAVTEPDFVLIGNPLNVRETKAPPLAAADPAIRIVSPQPMLLLRPTTREMRERGELPPVSAIASDSDNSLEKEDERAVEAEQVFAALTSPQSSALPASAVIFGPEQTSIPAVALSAEAVFAEVRPLGPLTITANLLLAGPAAADRPVWPKKFASVNTSECEASSTVMSAAVVATLTPMQPLLLLRPTTRETLERKAAQQDAASESQPTINTDSTMDAEQVFTALTSPQSKVPLVDFGPTPPTIPAAALSGEAVAADVRPLGPLTTQSNMLLLRPTTAETLARRAQLMEMMPCVSVQEAVTEAAVVEQEMESGVQFTENSVTQDSSGVQFSETEAVTSSAEPILDDDYNDTETDEVDMDALESPATRSRPAAKFPTLFRISTLQHSDDEGEDEVENEDAESVDPAGAPLPESKRSYYDDSGSADVDETQNQLQVPPLNVHVPSTDPSTVPLPASSRTARTDRHSASASAAQAMIDALMTDSANDNDSQQSWSHDDASHITPRVDRGATDKHVEEQKEVDPEHEPEQVVFA